MAEVSDGTSIVERLKAYHEGMGYKFRGPVGIVSSFHTKESRFEDDTRDFVGMATTDTLDVQEEVVLPYGANKAYFETNKKVFFDHEYDGTHAVGIYRNSKRAKNHKGNDGWLTRVHVPDSPNPLTQHLMAMSMDPDGCPGYSIGFEAIDYGRPTTEEQKRYRGAKSIVRTWNWIELSFTFMPANVVCQTMAMVRDDSKASVARALLRKNNAPKSLFRLMNLGDPPMLEIPAPMLEVA